MNRKTFYICVLIVLLGGATSWWIIRSRSQPTSEASRATAYTIVKGSKISIPNTASWKGVSEEDLPEELIPPTSEKTLLHSSRSVVYENGQIGYVLVSNVSNALSLSSVYQADLKYYTVDRPWKIISGSSSEQFSMLELENDTYFMQIQYQPISGGNIQISTQIVKK